MTRPAPKGWCPGAHRPMMSGDGLLVRVGPPMGRLTAAQAAGLCAAAERHGNGVIEVTRRANLQLRGVTEGAHGALLAELAGLDLVDADPAADMLPGVMVTPLWQTGDATSAVAGELAARLHELPALPAKFGIAVDAGAAPVLSNASADIRVERGGDGLLVRADGTALGRPVGADAAADAVIGLARWFARTPGPARRMAGAGPPPPEWRVAPPRRPAGLAPGASPLGPFLGVPFGQMLAPDLARAMRQSGAAALRTAPGRLLLLEGGAAPAEGPFVTRAGDPLMAVDACPGAPACAAAGGGTRALARALAGRVAGGVHVSGCAKGCARARPARVTLVARAGRFDLVKGGAAWDTPTRRGLSAEDVLAAAETL